MTVEGVTSETGSSSGADDGDGLIISGKGAGVVDIWASDVCNVTVVALFVCGAIIVDIVHSASGVFSNGVLFSVLEQVATTAAALAAVAERA